MILYGLRVYLGSIGAELFSCYLPEFRRGFECTDAEPVISVATVGLNFLHNACSQRKHDVIHERRADPDKKSFAFKRLAWHARKISRPKCVMLGSMENYINSSQRTLSRTSTINCLKPYLNPELDKLQVPREL